MNAVHSMSTKQVQALNDAILASIATEINTIQDARQTMGRDTWLNGDDVRHALEAALLLRFRPAGGVLLVWWDAEDGLRMNPAPYPVNDGGSWGG